MKETIENIINNDELLEIARVAIENKLLELRNSRISVLRANGLVIREKDGSNSDIIRMGSECAIITGLKAILDYLEQVDYSNECK